MRLAERTKEVEKDPSLGGEEDALSVPHRQKEKVSTLFSLLQYEPSTVAVIHELVLPTEGNSFFPPGLQRL